MFWNPIDYHIVINIISAEIRQVHGRYIDIRPITETSNNITLQMKIEQLIQ